MNASRTTITSARVGDVVTMRLTLPQDVYFFALEDTLPAELEVINRLLLTDLPVYGEVCRVTSPNCLGAAADCPSRRLLRER